MSRFTVSDRALSSVSSALVAVVVVVVGAGVVLAPAASGATDSATVADEPLPCVSEQPPVVIGEQGYCPGYVIGVKRGAYGSGAPIVLQGVTVFGVAGTDATVSGGPSCLDPTKFCGALIPSVTVSLTSLSGRPGIGDVVDVYGITATNSLQADGYTVIGRSDCAPDFC